MIKITAVIFASLSTALAQPPVEPAESPVAPQVRLELLVARLAEAKALELQPALREPAKCGAALEKILAMIGRKEAELVDWPILITKSGLLARTENVHEVLYASEYTAPDVKLPTDETGPTAVPNPTAPPDGEKKPEKPKVPLAFRVIGGLPAGFDHRDAGVTLEVEPTVREDGLTVDMHVAPQDVILTGTHKISVEHSSMEKVTVEQPDFRVIKTNTNLTVTSGQSVLLAFQKLPEQPGKIEVFILTTSVLRSEPKTPDKPAKRRAK